MKSRELLKYLIFFLLIIILIIITILLNIIENKKEKQTNEINSSNIINNETSNTNNIYTGETGFVKYKREHLDSFEFNIGTVPSSVSSYIKDEEELYISLKEYVYLNGLIEANLAEYEKSEIQKSTDRIAIVFKLNDSQSTELLAIINLKDNSVRISKYK